ncbi:CAP domain-containing protein [Nonomuraea deserti]|uniref:CAP domain-containing protein n=1 Tax=Nonomuraea deserti TaxID=1848322 RepID=A0A4R4VH64_9ACTN|nr:CAP domain-containing protein [Nonomuraea deserti]TDD01385.1 CAP domain-containing protein [Nonomuraea deserti]
MRRPLGVLAGLVTVAALGAPLGTAQAATTSEAACRVNVAKPRLGSKAQKITSFAVRRGCFGPALLRIRIKRAVPGRDPVVKSGATRNGRITLKINCRPGTYYAFATDYRGHTVKSKAAKLTCDPGDDATPTPSTPPPSSGGVGTAVENEVVKLTNAERAKGGCGPLEHDPKLRAAAVGHSSDMAEQNKMAHKLPGRPDLRQRIEAAGLTGFRAWGENVAWGQPSAASVVRAWMNSSGHRANIMNCRYNLIGVGAKKDGQGRIYWTQDFVTK